MKKSKTSDAIIQEFEKLQLSPIRKQKKYGKRGIELTGRIDSISSIDSKGNLNIPSNDT